jgi:CHASE2 domain-containing sensor protein
MDGTFYLLGSLVVGLLLMADIVILIRRHGVADTKDDGEAVGWTRFFMLAEAGWLGASFLALTTGTTRPLVPALYLAYSAIVLVMGFASNATEGPVRSFKSSTLKAFLGLSLVFTLVTAHQLALSFN